MRFQLLGPFEVVASEPVTIPRRRERCLLAVLLLEQGRSVPVDRLTELLWDGEPTPSTRTTLTTHVSRLRSVLDPAEVRIGRHGRGYALHTDPDQIDAIRFQTLVRQARDVTGPDRAQVLRSALALWRGPALADVATNGIRVRYGIGLEELRLEALDLRVEADLAAGRHRELIVELRELVGAHPGRERFTAHLMLALYRSERQAEALRVYEDGRRILADELGVDPGPELRRLHERILHGDPALDLPDSAPGLSAVDPRRDGSMPIPAQLPADVMGFTGRTRYLSQLDALLAHTTSGTSTAVAISAIAGTGGVGKTALAVRWAHRAKAHFPDGQLYVNLCGYSPNEPVPPAEALAGFLRALGVDGRAIPEELADRAALFRSRMSGLRMLVIVDNAHSVDVVRPLLPGTPESFVVITSRDPLRGLAVREGAQSLELDALSIDESRLLLEKLVSERVRVARASTDALAARCARLPLALRLVADLAGRRPEVALTQLADELADEQNRLSLLSVVNDPYASIGPVFSWSYQKLSPPAARLFRMLGLVPGDDVGRDAAAALLHAPVDLVSRQFAELTDAHLLEEHSPGRFRLHDLLRAYAREKAEQEEPDDLRKAALDRLIEFYLATSARAKAVIASNDTTIQAMAWLETERPNLMAVTRYAAEHGQWRQTSQLSETLHTFLDQRGYYDDARILHEFIVEAARNAGDHAVESRALIGLGLRHWRLGQYRKCEAYFEDARKVASSTGALDEEAHALNAIGLTYSRTGRYAQALVPLRQALTIGTATKTPTFSLGRTPASAWHT